MAFVLEDSQEASSRFVLEPEAEPSPRFALEEESTSKSFVQRLAEQPYPLGYKGIPVLEEKVPQAVAAYDTAVGKIPEAIRRHFLPETPIRDAQTGTVNQISVPRETLKGTARELMASGLTFNSDVLAGMIVAGPAFKLAGKIPLPGGINLGQLLNTPLGKDVLKKRVLPPQVQATTRFRPESQWIAPDPVSIEEASEAARQGAAHILSERPLSPDEILELYKLKYQLEPLKQASTPQPIPEIAPPSVANLTTPEARLGVQERYTEMMAEGAPKPAPRPILPQLAPEIAPRTELGELLRQQMLEVEQVPLHPAKAGRAALRKIFGEEAGFLALPEDDDTLKAMGAAAQFGAGQATAKFAENINLSRIHDTSLRAAMQEYIERQPGVATTTRITNEELIKRAGALTDTPIIRELVSLPEGTLESQALRNREDALATIRNTLDKTVGPSLKTELDAAIQQYRQPASVFARALQAQSIPVEARQLVVQALDTRLKQIVKDPVLGRDPQLLNQLGRLRQELISKEFLTPDAMDKLYFAWLNSILSSPTTHAVNTLSNLAFAWSKIPEKFFAAVADVPTAMVTGKRTQYFGEIPAQIRGAFSKTKVPLAEATKLDLKKLTNPFGSGRGAQIIGAPTQLLQIEDDLSKTLVGKMELFGQAYRVSAQLGLKGADAKALQAQLIADPSKALFNQVQKEQLYRTFQDAPSRLGAGLMSLRKEVPGVRFILPFIRTPDRILHAGFVERTPLKLASIARRAFRWKKIGEAYSQEEFTKDAGQLMMGSAIAGWAGLQYLKGHITGNAPSDPAERAAFYAMGKKPNAFRITLPDGTSTYVPFSRVEPWGTAISSVVNLMQDYGKSEKEIPTDKALDAMAGLTKTLTNKSYLSSLAHFVSTLSDPERQGGSFVARGVAGMVPQAVGLAAQLQNPYYLNPQGVREHVMAKIPVLSEQVPKRLGRFGEPQRRAPLDISQEHISRVDGELNRLGHSIEFPSQSIGDRKLTNKEFNELMEIAGPLSYQTLDRMVGHPAYQVLSDTEKMKEIDAVVREDREAARERIRLRLVNRALQGATSGVQRTGILRQLREEKVLTKELYFELKERGVLNAP